MRLRRGPWLAVMFSRVLSRGFFRQGFPGWYRGKFSEVVPSNPGKFTLGVAVASCAVYGTTAGFMLDGLIPQLTLGDETAGFGLDYETATFTLERQF